LIVAAADRGLGDLLVVDQGALDLDCREPVAGDVYDVVDAAHQPEVAVRVDPGPVAHEVDILVLRPVGLLVAFWLPEEPTKHGRVRLAEDQVAASTGADLVAAFVEDGGVDGREWLARRAGLGGGHARQRCDQDHAGLRLPPGVYDRAAAAADVLLVPDPGLGVDRLAHRAEQAQRAEVVLLEIVRPPLHECADGGGRGIDDADLVALDDLPEAVLVRVVGTALVDHSRSAVGERAVDDVTVTGDPADVGGAPVHSVGLDVEDVVVSTGHPDE